MRVYTAANRFRLLKGVSRHGALGISLFATSFAPMEFPRVIAIQNHAQATRIVY
jgi:hypothetical protein